MPTTAGSNNCWRAQLCTIPEKVTGWACKFRSNSFLLNVTFSGCSHATTLKFSLFVAYKNPNLNLKYLKAITAGPVRFPALLELNAHCYSVGKKPRLPTLYGDRGPWKCDNLPKSTFSAPLYTIWKGWHVTYSEFFGNFSLYTSHVFTDHSQMSSFLYVIALQVHIVVRIEFSCPWIGWRSQLAL